MREAATLPILPHGSLTCRACIIACELVSLQVFVLKDTEGLHSLNLVIVTFFSVLEYACGEGSSVLTQHEAMDGCISDTVTLLLNGRLFVSVLISLRLQ